MHGLSSESGNVHNVVNFESTEQFRGCILGSTPLVSEGHLKEESKGGEQPIDTVFIDAATLTCIRSFIRMRSTVVFSKQLQLTD